MACADVHSLEWNFMAKELAFKANAISNKLGVSRRQLQRYTRKLFGLSPQRWLKKQRLIAAGSMLMQHHSVKFVSLELGFKQPAHFCREFKMFYGLSPSRFMACGGSHTTQNDQMANSELKRQMVLPIWIYRNTACVNQCHPA
jgi:AraC-like DNA-binding protein